MKSLLSALAWLDEHRRQVMSVTEISVNESREWRMSSSRIDHYTGGFFSIEALRVKSIQQIRGASQPIINQPEIGILGFLGQIREGKLHLLVQAKDEPGNVGGAQMAPTLQATFSNFTAIHGGRIPAFLEHFLNTKRKILLVNQLQSEQGSRFLKKRNRNLLRLVGCNEHFQDNDFFKWISLEDFRSAMKRDYTVNTDARSIVASMGAYPFLKEALTSELRKTGDSFYDDLLASLVALDKPRCRHSIAAIREHFKGLKRSLSFETEKIDLNQLEEWELTGSGLRHSKRKRFDVMQIAVESATREVPFWDQPIISSSGKGVVSLFYSYFSGVMHFLFQGRGEIGNYDSVEYTATVQCAPGEDREGAEESEIYFDHYMCAANENIRFKVEQSEEGGRFFRDVNEFTLIRIDEPENLDPHPNFIWMTLGQAKSLIKEGNVFTNEVRSLLATL